MRNLNCELPQLYFNPKTQTWEPQFTYWDARYQTYITLFDHENEKKREQFIRCHILTRRYTSILDKTI